MRRRAPWWLWPGVMTVLALVSLICAWILTPGPDELCYVFGSPFGGECAFQVVTGHPCPQCGMTRSFAWGARGHFLRAFAYSPGGFTLFLWLQAGGIVGLARLVTRDPRKLEPPAILLASWAIAWLILFYALPWVVRLFGYNPLP